MWSFQLALRAEVWAAATTLHLGLEGSRQLLGIPPHMTQAGLIPVAYTKGTDFKPRSSLPVEEITYLDTYKNPIA